MSRYSITDREGLIEKMLDYDDDKYNAMNDDELFDLYLERFPIAERED